MAVSSCLITLLLLFIVNSFPASHADPITSCPPQSIKCNITKVCVDSKYICDGDNDCGDGEDEQNCRAGDSGCGGVSIQTGMSGTIESMGYPTNYSNLADCRWYLRAPADYILMFSFYDVFDIEKPHHGQCIYDAITIYRDVPLQIQDEYCGNLNPGQVVVNGSQAVVEFRSDGRNSGRGFRLKWTAQPVKQNRTGVTATQSPKTSNPPSSTPLCQDVREINDGFGHIMSPSFLESKPYPVPLLCRWRIKVLPSYSIVLNFDFLDVGMVAVDGCKDGWLEVYDGEDGNSSLIAQFCGNKVPEEQRSTTNEVFVVMKASNNADNHAGFELSFSAFRSDVTSTTGPLPPGCDGNPIIMTSPHGYITSPNFNKSGSYSDHLDCEWILLGIPGNVFYFTFHDFEIEESGGCAYDSLTIFDTVFNNSVNFNDTVFNKSVNFSDTFFNKRVSHNEIKQTLDKENNDSNVKLVEVAKRCGVMLPYDVESNSNRVVLRFKTDAQYEGLGFNLSYTLQLPTVKCREDEFKCGNSECIKYPLVCDNNADCADGTDELICSNSSTCGLPAIQPIISRIVGGTEAVEGSWPWTVSIVYSTPKESIHDCGATLILPQWALTAAHCFESVYSRKYDGYYLIAGRHQVEHPDKHEQIREFDQVFLRHDYSSATSLNDIALIKVKEPFNLTDYVSLACLPDEPAPTGQLCYVTGWGQTLTTCCAGRMKQAGVPIINSTLCSQPDYYGNVILEHMMCAGYPEGGIDTCDGDSGGPLVCETRSGDRHWEVQGVTSWGIMCAEPKQPGVYTIVHDYIPWIQQIIALNSP